jgi:hypothetical protein
MNTLRCLRFVVAVTVAFSLDAFAAKRQAVGHPTTHPIQRVFLVIMENENPGPVLSRPFATRLLSEGGLLTNFHCITHPSQPNYIGLAAGSTWGVVGNTPLTLDVRHLGDLVEERGLSWRVYAEQYPGNCYTGSSTSDGLFVRRHVPFLEFRNVVKNPERCKEHIVEGAQLDIDVEADALPSFSFYVPNQDHNGHDTGPAYADAWLTKRFTPLLDDPRFTEGTLFILTWDESEDAGTEIAAIFWGAGVVPGSRSARYYDHYDLLRTIEEVLHTGTLGQNDASNGEMIQDVLALP